MVLCLDKMDAFKKSTTEPLVPGLNDEVNIVGNFSCDTILFPSKGIDEPLN